MTVIADQKKKVCNLCKRPIDLISKNTTSSNGVSTKAADAIEQKKSIQGRSSRRIGPVKRMLSRYLHPSIERIIYWRNIRKTMMIFFAGIMLFTAINYYSLISVISLLSLALLTSVFILKICGRIFGKNYLNSNWPKCENVDAIVLKILNVTLFVAAELRDVIFVKDILKTLKFCFILHIWTIIGDFMNGYTLLVCAFVAMFIVPKTCELMWPKLLKFAGTGIQYCISKIPFMDLDD